MADTQAATATAIASAVNVLKGQNSASLLSSARTLATSASERSAEGSSERELAERVLGLVNDISGMVQTDRVNTMVNQNRSGQINVASKQNIVTSNVQHITKNIVRSREQQPNERITTPKLSNSSQESMPRVQMPKTRKEQRKEFRRISEKNKQTSRPYGNNPNKLETIAPQGPANQVARRGGARRTKRAKRTAASRCPQTRRPHQRITWKTRTRRPTS